ncbi:ABC-2 family transporter protein [filamentous cyanobacterium LEGE 11480]|uniref:ABC-2 family transporter protein n=1 Tax=Romeriopsis navalis LEGE 11480 TaxID=2777977 RepID=A0A928VJA9_9CYAN|nr:ABC-2 family transporter protein [Romeriopsis navalis]MBE9029668.1 ABC-2 family transporter protein [Romeriopsis navalis LEGE 11480]
MNHTFHLAKTLLTTYYAYMVEYRAELVLWVLSGSLPIILMGAWIQAAESGNFTLSTIQVAQYFFTVAITRQFTVVWVIWDFEKAIVEGKLSMKLLQPLDPGWHHVADHLGERLARFPIIIGFVLLFFLLYPAAFWIPSVGQCLTYTFVVASAFMLQFLLQYTLAMFAFWTEKASSLQELSFLMYIFLSGVVAPIAVFPENVKQFVQWLPYPYVIDFPANILTGLPVDLPRGILMIYGWSALLWVINRWLWKRGLRQYSGMGA